MEFELKRISGISPKHLSGEINEDAELTITRKFEQSVSGSAPMKVAGQIISIIQAYPRAFIVIDMKDASITKSQLEVLKSHIKHLNRGWLSVPRIKLVLE